MYISWNKTRLYFFIFLPTLFILDASSLSYEDEIIFHFSPVHVLYIPLILYIEYLNKSIKSNSISQWSNLTF